jgi:dienelactone hydrolase
MKAKFENKQIGNEVSISDLANASKSDYTSDEAPPNFSRVKTYGKGQVNVYKHNTSDEYIVSHRGTDFSKKRKSVMGDIIADFNIAIGNTNADKANAKRMKYTEKAIDVVRADSNSGNIYLTGHSLGGSTSLHSMMNSDKVRNNVSEHHTFNAGSSIINNRSAPKQIIKEINEKTTHHHIAGDAISKHVDKMPGKSVEYASKAKVTMSEKILNVAKPLLHKSAAGTLMHKAGHTALKTLSSHSLDNFNTK